MEITQKDAEKLRELEESLWRAETRFDLEYMQKVLAPDFFEFGRSGRIYTREETLSAPVQDINSKFPLSDFTIHSINANVVLVTYKSEVVEGGTTEIGNRSSVWLKTGDRWQLKFHQGTVVPH